MPRGLMHQHPVHPMLPAGASAHPPHFVLEYAPEFLEAALLHALEGHPHTHTFHQQRDPLYEIADPEAREASFCALHAAWFARLRLGQAIEQVLQEYPMVVQQVRVCRVLRARAAADEGAELFVASPPLSPTLLVPRRAVGWCCACDPRTWRLPPPF